MKNHWIKQQSDRHWKEYLTKKYPDHEWIDGTLESGMRPKRFMKAVNAALNKDEWNHVAIQFDGTASEIYVNGKALSAEDWAKRREARKVRVMDDLIEEYEKERGWSIEERIISVMGRLVRLRRREGVIMDFELSGNNIKVYFDDVPCLCCTMCRGINDGELHLEFYGVTEGYKVWKKNDTSS